MENKENRNTNSFAEENERIANLFLVEKNTIYGICQKYLNAETRKVMDADDAVQETMIKVIRQVRNQGDSVNFKKPGAVFQNTVRQVYSSVVRNLHCPKRCAVYYEKELTIDGTCKIVAKPYKIRSLNNDDKTERKRLENSIKDNNDNTLSIRDKAVDIIAQFAPVLENAPAIQQKIIKAFFEHNPDNGTFTLSKFARMNNLEYSFVMKNYKEILLKLREYAVENNITLETI